MTDRTIRNAVHAGEYARAVELFEAYAQSRPISAASLVEMGELVAWARLEILCARAHARARLQERRDAVHVAASYGHGEPLHQANSHLLTSFSFANRPAPAAPRVNPADSPRDGATPPENGRA